jgi:hypothetical protein
MYEMLTVRILCRGLYVPLRGATLIFMISNYLNILKPPVDIAQRI